jgi:hypothetical protein
VVSDERWRQSPAFERSAAGIDFGRQATVDWGVVNRFFTWAVAIHVNSIENGG